jgi:hypothetical protein
LIAAASALHHTGHSDIQNFGVNIPKGTFNVAPSSRYPETEYVFVVPFQLQIEPHYIAVQRE